MSGRRVLRVSKGVTNADPAAWSQRSGTPSAQLTARLRSRTGGSLLGSSSTPSLGHALPFPKQGDFSGSPNQVDGKVTGAEEESPLPLLNGQQGGVPPRPSTTAGAFGRSSTNAGSLKMEGRREGLIFTPPRSSPGLSRREAGLFNGSRASSGSRSSCPSNGANGKGRTTPSVRSLSPGTQTTTEGRTGGGAGGGDVGGDGGCRIAQDVMDDGNAEIPLGLHKLSRDDLEVYVHVVRTALARQARRKQAAPLNSSTVSTTTPTIDSHQTPQSGRGGGGKGADGGTVSGHGDGGRGKRGVPRRKASTGSRGERDSVSTLDMKAAMCSPGGGKHQVDRGRNVRRKHRLLGQHHHHHYHHHHHHHQQLQQRSKPRSYIPIPGVSGVSRPAGGARAICMRRTTRSLQRKHSSEHREKRRASGGGLMIPPPTIHGGSDRGLSDSHSGTVGGDRSWYARSKGSKTVPLRTLMLDPEVNNIPQVNTQSDFRALIKAQNIPHPSYDIDGDGIVSQEDYALAKRFDYNGDGVLDEAEMFVGRRIMAELFLEKHSHDLHLYGNGLSQKSMAANVENISRSHGFKKVMNGLREKEKNLTNHGSNDVRDCVTLKPESLTRHNFFSDKFDTTAWNDFTRDPRDAGWLESRAHDGSRNQMHFMRKIEARESAQKKLNAGYPGGDSFSTRRVKLITDPAVENS